MSSTGNAFSTCGHYASRIRLDPNASLWDHSTITWDRAADRFTDTNGCEFRQLFQEVPLLRYLYTDWEMTFDAWPYVNFADRHMNSALLICAAYLAFVFLGRKCMIGRKPFGLKGALAVWSLALSVFSAIGFLRTAPHLLYFLFKDGFYASICRPSEPAYGHGAAGLWVMLFIFSKVPELGDTVFIVLRKTPLIFLHWYHHVTVLLYCWHSYATRSSAGLYFVSMNYGVHALMYFYYFLSARGIKASWAGLVTTLQISQMFVGMFVCAAVYYYGSVEGLMCDIIPENYFAGLAMYMSYAALFIVFALEKYIFGTSSLETKKKDGKAKVEDAGDAALQDGAAGSGISGVSSTPTAVSESKEKEGKSNSDRAAATGVAQGDAGKGAGARQRRPA